ncbi:MAG: phosphoglycerate kinase [Actinomycetota bacterium]
MDKKTVRDIDVAGKKVLVRVDFNVPLNERQEIQDNSRIKAALPTINYLLENKAKVILVSHLGRPKGKIVPEMRMDPVAKELARLLGKKVIKLDEAINGDVDKAVSKLNDDELILLENIRFYPEETEDDPEFSKKLAACADLFVNDAFGTAHRAHASTVGVTEYLPAVAGFLLEKEVDALNSLIKNPTKPFIAVLGGNKIGDKLGVINSFLELCDGLMIGGGMCFTFLKAQGLNIGDSLLDGEQFDAAKNILAQTEQEGIPLYLPEDFVIADSFAENAATKTVAAEEIPDGWMGLDIGPRTIELYKEVLEEAKTIFWNGPMGVFEWPAFADGTKGIAEALAESSALTIVGGGDSDSALKKFGVEDKIDHVSTGGGASMKVLEGKPLPAVDTLLDK